MLNLNEMMEKTKGNVTKNKTIVYLYEMPFNIDEN